VFASILIGEADISEKGTTPESGGRNWILSTSGLTPRTVLSYLPVSSTPAPVQTEIALFQPNARANNRGIGWFI